MPTSVSLRWLAVSVFIVSSVLNYLDRNLLSALSPFIMAEFHFNQTGFGWLISAFSITYAFSSLAAGWALDRFGVNRTIYAAAAWWSTAALSTGLVGSFPALGFCRSALGIGESAGVSAVGKLNAIYLNPEERALGAALNQIGISVGSALAVYWGVQAASAHGWRWPFMLAGICGFVWLPVGGSSVAPSPPNFNPPNSPAKNHPSKFSPTATYSSSSSPTSCGWAVTRSGLTGPPST